MARRTSTMLDARQRQGVTTSASVATLAENDDYTVQVTLNGPDAADPTNELRLSMEVSYDDGANWSSHVSALYVGGQTGRDGTTILHPRIGTTFLGGAKPDRVRVVIDNTRRQLIECDLIEDVRSARLTP